MQNIAIIDLVLAAVLIGFAIVGAVRGLYRSLAGLLVLVLAIAGAAWLTETCAAGVEDVLRPALTERMEKIVSEAMLEETAKIEDIADTEPILAVEQFLRRFGWDGDLGETLRQSTENALTDVEKALASALVENMLPLVVSAVLKTVFFLLLLVVLRLISRLLQPLIEYLPVVRQCNKLLGAAAGFLQGVIAIYVVFWFLERLGLTGSALPAQSYLLSLFIR